MARAASPAILSTDVTGRVAPPIEASVGRDGVNYRAAMTEAPDGFDDALTGTYTTDPQYEFILKRVIHNYGLVRYDR